MLPRARKVLETKLRKLAPAVLILWVFKNWSGQPELTLRRLRSERSATLWDFALPRGCVAPASPDWHSGILLLDDGRERQKEQTPLSPSTMLRAHPLEYFTAVLSVFQAHLPVHDMAGHAKPLDWKSQGRGIRQYRSAS